MISDIKYLVSAPGLVRSLAPAPASLVQLPAAYASLPAIPNNLGGAALASDTLAKAALTYISDTGLDTCGQLTKVRSPPILGGNWPPNPGGRIFLSQKRPCKRNNNIILGLH